MNLESKGIDYDDNNLESKEKVESLLEGMENLDGLGSFLLSVKDDSEKIIKKQTYSREDSPLD